MSWNPLRGMTPSVTSVGGAKAYPFSAIVGADRAKLALLLHAVNPRLGGVLLIGAIGSGKTTLVHALRQVLPPTRAVAGCRYVCEQGNPDPYCPDGPHDTQIGHRRPASLIHVPHDTDVSGSFSGIASSGESVAGNPPGGLSLAHRGVLLFQQVTSYSETVLADTISAATRGRVALNTDSSYAVDSVIVGTTTPTVLAHNPHLAEYFGVGVCVELGNRAELRAEVIRHRLEYDVDPSGFQDRYAAADAALTRRIIEARARLQDVTMCDTTVAAIVAACQEHGLPGSRADVVTAKVALTHAAWAGRIAVIAQDIAVATALTLTAKEQNPATSTPPEFACSTSHKALEPGTQQAVVDIRDQRPAPTQDESHSPTTGRTGPVIGAQHSGESLDSEPAQAPDAQPPVTPATAKPSNLAALGTQVMNQERQKAFVASADPETLQLRVVPPVAQAPDIVPDACASTAPAARQHASHNAPTRDNSEPDHTTDQDGTDMSAAAVVPESDGRSVVTWQWPGADNTPAADSTQVRADTAADPVATPVNRAGYEPLWEPTVWPEPDEEPAAVPLPVCANDEVSHTSSGPVVGQKPCQNGSTSSHLTSSVGRGQTSKQGSPTDKPLHDKRQSTAHIATWVGGPAPMLAQHQANRSATQWVRCVNSPDPAHYTVMTNLPGSLLFGQVTKPQAGAAQTVTVWAATGHGATASDAAWAHLWLPLVVAGSTHPPGERWAGTIDDGATTPVGPLVVFGVDTSGMGGAAERLALAADAMTAIVESTSTACTQVALVTFCGARAHLVVPPTTATVAIAAAAQATTGGRAPLAEGIMGVANVARTTQTDGATVAVLVTDGRATYGDDAVARSRKAVQLLAGEVGAVVMVDCEKDQPGRLRLRLVERLAELAGAPMLSFSDVTAATVAALAQEATAQSA